MKPRDKVYLGALLAFAGFIWWRDTAWMSSASETLPIAAALPLVYWLGAPWRFQPGDFTLRRVPLAVAGILVVLGLALDLTFPLAAAWTLALWSWLRARVEGDHPRLRRLALLPLLAFPWLTLDLPSLGWWFRLSAAWVVDHVFGAIGFAITREGTNLLVHGLPIEVAAACSGMNSLQAMLIAGILLAVIELRGSRWFWLGVATLPALAWAANVLRVCTIVAVALGWGPGFAGGWFHETGGWVVVMLAFLGWWFLLRLGGQWRRSRPVGV